MSFDSILEHNYNDILNFRSVTWENREASFSETKILFGHKIACVFDTNYQTTCSRSSGSWRGKCNQIKIIIIGISIKLREDHDS